MLGFVLFFSSYSQFSPWLAHGCLSPRYVAAECVRYEATRKKNKSTYWMVWELTVRDYTRYKCLKLGDRIFTGRFKHKEGSGQGWVLPLGWRRPVHEQGALPFLAEVNSPTHTLFPICRTPFPPYVRH